MLKTAIKISKKCKQINTLHIFENKGGFSERMYQQRLQKRKNENGIA